MKKTILYLLLMAILAVSVFAIVTNKSPTACNGAWGSCTNAFASDASRATATSSGPNITGSWKNYTFTLDGSDTINSVIVTADFFASRTSGFISVRVSGDGGQTFGPGHVVGGVTSEQTFLINVTNDVAWTAAKLNKTNLVVNVSCFKSGGGPNPQCRLDWIPVNVTHTPFDFSLNATPSNATVYQPESNSTTIFATLLSGTSQLVNLSVLNCPTGAICSFNQSSGNPTFGAVLTVDTSTSTPAGTYNINVSGTGAGKTRTTIFKLTVLDSLPVADATSNVSSGDEPLSVAFTGGVTGGNSPFTYFWNFQDGTNSTDQDPQHTFSAGTYNVSFTVTDNDNDFSTDYVLITVAGDTVPSVSITANQTKGNVPMKVRFNSTVTSGNGPFSYSWNFQDGNTSTLANPNNTFTVMGIYNVSLTVTDVDGDMADAFVLINATQPNLLISNYSFFEFLNATNATKVNITARVLNDGNGAAGIFSVFLGDLNNFKTVFGLSAGQFTFVSAAIDCPAPMQVNLTVDAFNSVRESNEFDNFNQTETIDCII